MIKGLHKIAAGLIIALGCLHITFTFFNYDSFSLDAMWFAGAGLAIVLAGFLNVILIRDIGRDPVVRALCQIANISFALLFAVALTLMQQPQVFVGVLLFGGAAVLGLLKKPNP
jgi:hypothetical protein